MKRTYIILIILIAGILIGTYIFISEWNRKPRNVSKATPDHTLSTSDMLGTFKADTAAADTKFKDAVVQLSGVADEVESGGESTIVLFHGDGVDLSCSFLKKDNPKLSIEPKSNITFKGKYTGYIIDDIFGPKAEVVECVLVEK